MSAKAVTETTPAEPRLDDHADPLEVVLDAPARHGSGALAAGAVSAAVITALSLLRGGDPGETLWLGAGTLLWTTLGVRLSERVFRSWSQVRLVFAPDAVTVRLRGHAVDRTPIHDI